MESYRRVSKELAAVLDTFPGRRPELMMDEWNQDFPPLFAGGEVRDLGPWVPEAYDLLSVEEMAMQGRRAATAAKIMLTMLETLAGLVVLLPAVGQLHVPR